MSTPYAEFTDLDGRNVYVDASGALQRINLCSSGDINIYFRMGKEQADALIQGLWLSYSHNGWELPYPWDSEGEEHHNSAKARLRTALEELLKHHLDMVDSGTVGFRNPDEEPVVYAARQALATTSR